MLGYRIEYRLGYGLGLGLGLGVRVWVTVRVKVWLEYHGLEYELGYDFLINNVFVIMRIIIYMGNSTLDVTSHQKIF